MLICLPDTEGGYHGYWAKNLYEINENYGTAEDLKSLVSAAHEKVHIPLFVFPSAGRSQS